MKNEFIKCGFIGCGAELIWTTIGEIRKKNYKLEGHTSAWMFPIYGMACVIEPLSRKLKNRKENLFTRGTIYTGMIFGVEYITGTVLKKVGKCPWDYSSAKYNIKGVIRLDYAPLWFGMGLLYEGILSEGNDRNKSTINSKQHKKLLHR